ncbi:glycoside hydrolase family 2 TIM barrel-domain containing protein [Paenibacillus alkalitolerans]|uniref:glycoside hydrolase family 2 TIM barrel-domain containing protein n=1 Tax=Paenibacillus alkalitolerans TaxID=2799335 RepID=UPI0018F77CD7|nr:glycoside hydrolase family 2 TIM barrel-domain containing protein [Paenibacillus alkalitolerans]
MNGRFHETFDWNWKFYLGDAKGAEEPDYSDGLWRDLSVPHDWSVEGEFDENHPSGGDGGYVQAGIGWYRKSFAIPAEWHSRKVTIMFDGVYMNSDVWINGRHLGRYPFGYVGFEYDLSPYLNYGGNNVIAVRVDNSDQPNSRWFTGSGIYRHTWLKATDKLHIPSWGVYVKTPVINDANAAVEVQTKIANERDQEGKATLFSEIIAPDGEIAAVHELQLDMASGETSEITQCLQVTKPALWSVETPVLYTLRTSLVQNGVVLDETETAFGIRKAEFDKDRGFLLNGKQVKINGVCLHHDGGAVGAAVPERVWERRLEILKAMGCNGIRMSHNPPAPELLELCDSMGFLVMDEAFDEWTITKHKNRKAEVHGYYEYFDEWSERDLVMMLRRDRNHPSIVIWSIGNEIPEQKVPDGWKIAKRLIEICRREDPTRPVTVACDNIEAEPIPAYQEFLDVLDVVGYNYVNRWRTRTETYYADDRHRYPNRALIGSENTGIGGVRGDYLLELPEKTRWYGTYATRMIAAEQLWKFTRMHDFVSGDFMWTGIDYIGETRWPNKNASFGVIDTCGFPKDGYFFYQSQWTTKPMAYVFPHWNWQGREGKVIPVLCYTNCDKAELFVNGKSFGVKAYEFPRQGMSKEWAHYEKTPVHVTTADLHLSWDVPYEAGELKLVGYSRDGDVMVKTCVSTTGAPAAIEVMPDRDVIDADGRDVTHFVVRVVDAAGRVVPTSDTALTFHVEGDGALIGVDSGKPDSHESYKSNVRKAFNGMALAIVQSTPNPGQIRVKVEAEGLGSVVIYVLTK